ncbi:MAG: hypothetical protein ACREJN_11695 [Nitrospiraceae bacterium]
MSDELTACRKAAEQGDAVTQFSLAEMYYQGQVIPQDHIQAHLWWNLAANAGDEWDQAMKENAYDLRFSLEQIMAPAQIAEAQRLASEWTMSRGTHFKACD